ncbi:MAG: efflux RND transporter periplasmic adaptor subunit [Rhodospirillaceae bacterium]|nr:efflux RND transporter periplasmic adaptor subunit [Rhodospirillaceae bacterium]MDE0362868.1 efflux RND transporter periplasmic adaptor subunit [Rhodospirillaceae bacterium]
MSESGTDRRPDLSALRMSEEDYSPRRARWWFWLVGGAIIAGGVYFAYRLPVPWLLPEVETTRVQVLTPTQASTVLTATGYTYARARAAVGAKIIGRVVELPVDEGDTIAAGDIIAVLDSEDLQASVRLAEASLNEARARLADAEREFARQADLVEDRLTSQALYDAALTQREVALAQVGTAEARLNSAQATLDYTVVRAPIDGVVIERNIEMGEMVAPGGFTSQQSTGSIVRIADPASLEVEADINESYIARLQLGQRASIRVDAVPGFEYSGRLRQIVPTADRQRAVVQVKVSIDNIDARLVPDMSCTVTFLEEGIDETELVQPPKLLVPEEAVQYAGNAAFLFRVDGNVLRRVRVVLGETSDGRVEALEGVSGGETVVSREVASLEDGQRVRIAGN